MSETKITLAQSPEQQQALFGYVVGDEKVFELVRTTMEVAGNFGWLNPHLTRLWAAIVRHLDTYGTYPTREEIGASPEVLDNEALMQKRLLRELDEGVKAKVAFGLEPLLSQLKDWQRAVLIDKQTTEMARKYNAGDIPAAIGVISDLCTRLESISASCDMLVPSTERLQRDHRLDASHRLRYGVSYLDEATGGIASNDLIVIGARTGQGKTQLITTIAQANRPKRIALFALEAEENEIEDRVRYGLARRIAEGKGEDLRGVTYGKWHSLQAPQLDKYNAQAVAATKASLANVRTYYRVSGEFGITEMERRLVSAAKDSDLIILDHLHYVDIEGKNEHHELARVVKRIRDIALGYGVPIVVVSHLRKQGTSKFDRKLVPEVDDLHGASEISKVATTVITFGPVSIAEWGSVPPVGWPTMLRIGKHRRGGDCVRYAGIAFFDSGRGQYQDAYALGRLKGADTNWEQEPPDHLPDWANRATVFIKSLDT